jgi:hypothetical protein
MRPRYRKLVDPPAEASQAAEGEATVRRPRDKPGVLVVDDNRLVRIMVLLGLERDGFDVWLASGGRDPHLRLVHAAPFGHARTLAI